YLRLTNDTIARNNLDGGSGPGGRTNGYQVYNLAYSPNWRTRETATLVLANTILAGAPAYGCDLVNQTFANRPNNQATVADVDPEIPTATNIITRPIANFDGNFVTGPGGVDSGGVVSVSYALVPARLEGLGKNGGWSETMALQPDSPARKAGLPLLA